MLFMLVLSAYLFDFTNQLVISQGNYRIIFGKNVPGFGYERDFLANKSEPTNRLSILNKHACLTLCNLTPFCKTSIKIGKFCIIFNASYNDDKLINSSGNILYEKTAICRSEMSDTIDGFYYIFGSNFESGRYVTANSSLTLSIRRAIQTSLVETRSTWLITFTGKYTKNCDKLYTLINNDYSEHLQSNYEQIFQTDRLYVYSSNISTTKDVGQFWILKKNFYKGYDIYNSLTYGFMYLTHTFMLTWLRFGIASDWTGYENTKNFTLIKI
ncbi:unnamed protein product [Brachionus calyciflorus]|uniref:Uncharacterized protein n=1 Tax=Brachionus calyciflorus TaxID=104777 RepID=A0A813ZVR3_9BILA|nr:unnamed protein product [Brachionus calyciflorus]